MNRDIGVYEPDTLYFTLTDGHITWQKVYSEAISLDDCIAILEGGPFVEINRHEDYISAKIDGLALDYKGYGMKAMTTPFYISGSFLSGNLRIEIKPDKYRVTITNIVMIQASDAGVFKQGDQSTLESIVLKSRNTKFKPAFTKSHHGVFNYTLDRFLSSQEKLEDEW